MSKMAEVLRQLRPMVDVFFADARAAAFAKRYQETGIAIRPDEAVWLALTQMAFRLPYTGKGREAGADITTIRDYEMVAARALANDGLPALIEESRRSPLAFRALRQALGHLREAGEAIPRELSEWACDVADGTRSSPKTGPGRSPYTNQVRDAEIIATGQALVDCGLTATRNEASESASACDAVREALEAHGEALSYDAIAKIWGRRDRAPRLQTAAPVGSG